MSASSASVSDGFTPRVACVGAGYWGDKIVRNLNDLGALHTICDSDPKRLTELSSKYPEVRAVPELSDVLADPEVKAVAIATPAETHGRIVRMALEAGKDVLVEKPICLSLEEGRELVELADRLGRVLMVGHLLWYHPAVLKLKELMDRGELGRIQYIYSNRLNLGKIRREENILWSFAPHDLSVILGLVEERPDEVAVRGGNYLDQDIADVTVTHLSFPSGIKSHIFVSWLHPFKEQKLVVVGEDKMAVFNDVEPVDKLVVYPHTIGWRGDVPVADKAEGEVVPLERGEPLAAECRHFLERIDDRGTPRTDGAEALRVLEVLEAAQQDLDRQRHGSAGRATAGASASAGAAPGGGVAPSGVRVHETAWVDDGVEIGEGTTIWHFSHMMGGTRIGRDCRIGQNVVVGPNVEVGNGVKIQNNVSVYEGVTLEDHVFCGPSMVFTNVINPRSEVVRKDEYRATRVRRGATLGANCTIVCGTTIGRYAFIGAGTVVTRDVPDYALVVGNPGRRVGWMCECGHRVRVDGDGTGRCGECGCAYRESEDGLVQVGSLTVGA